MLVEWFRGNIVEGLMGRWPLVLAGDLVIFDGIQNPFVLSVLTDLKYFSGEVWLFKKSSV
jgi:hypothetical protein